MNLSQYVLLFVKNKLIKSVLSHIVANKVHARLFSYKEKPSLLMDKQTNVRYSATKPAFPILLVLADPLKRLLEAGP